MPRRLKSLTRIGRTASKALAALAFVSFSVFLPTPVIAQSKGGGEHRVKLHDSIASQKARPLGNKGPFAWVTRFSKASRDFGYLLIPGPRSFVPLGVAGGIATAAYYNNIRPHPTQCQPPALDKWQHCYVGCEISSWYPVGSLSATLLAVLKEVRDVLGHGEFDWADVRATMEGTWDCPVWESCEEFCCMQFS
jgi:hypothetical protein